MGTRYYKYRYKAHPSVIDFFNRGEDPEAPPIPEGARRVTGGTYTGTVPSIMDRIREITGGGVDMEPEEVNGNGEVSLEGDTIEGTGTASPSPSPPFDLSNISPDMILIGLGVGALVVLAIIFTGKK